MRDLTVKFLKEEQKERVIRNIEQVKDYFLQKCENNCKDTTEYEYEKLPTSLAGGSLFAGNKP